MEQNTNNIYKQNAEDELRNNIKNYLMHAYIVDPEKESSLIYDQFIKNNYITITAPEQNTPMLSFMTLNDLTNYDIGLSIKPGNIILNMKNFAKNIPGFVVMGAGIKTEIPILMVCAALNLWVSFVDLFKIKITKDQAFLIVALWKNCDAYYTISIDNGIEAVNALLENYGESLFTLKKYNKVLDSLEQIKCIELENGEIRLIERISRKYLDRVYKEY